MSLGSLPGQPTDCMQSRRQCEPYSGVSVGTSLLPQAGRAVGGEAQSML
jgi:hypothetical protein